MAEKKTKNEAVEAQEELKVFKFTVGDKRIEITATSWEEANEKFQSKKNKS